ncbi:MAG: hypothetical protein QOG54_2318 [Actinomycetota bacterium]|nr:hypothetical protein [Actinomycetota bacterium]
MLRALKTSIAVLLSVGLLTSGASALELDSSESCQAINPAQPKCTLTITSESTSGTVTGAVGQGDWIVVVKRGKEKLTIKPTSTDPEPVSFDYVVGDKVTATVKSAGGWVVAGHD